MFEVITGELRAKLLWRGPLHPLRATAPDQKGCTAYGSGAAPTSHKSKRGSCETRAWLQCPWVAAGPDHRARDRQRDPRVTAITTSAKVAHNFPRSFFETARKRCNSNDANSMFEQAAGELRAKLLIESHSRTTSRRASHTTQPGPTGVEGAGGTCRGAGGRWRGLAGQRADAPSHRSATGPHWCGGRRRDRRARAGFEARRRTK